MLYQPIVIIAGFTSITFADITKSDFLIQLKANRTTMANIKQLFIGNTIEFYTNGSWKRTSKKI